MVAIPPTPDEPKVACNSGARTFYSTPKRCNSNDVMSNLEIHTGELHATFLRNHNMRHHKGPKQKTAQAQKTPTARGERRPQHSFPAAPTGGFTTIDTPPRRVAGVSQPYGRNSPHTPTAGPATASSMRISRHEPPVATAHASRRAPLRSTGAWPPWRHRLPLRHPQTRRTPTLVSCMIRRCPRWSTAT